MQYIAHATLKDEDVDVWQIFVRHDGKWLRIGGDAPLSLFETQGFEIPTQRPKGMTVNFLPLEEALELLIEDVSSCTMH